MKIKDNEFGSKSNFKINTALTLKEIEQQILENKYEPEITPAVSQKPKKTKIKTVKVRLVSPKRPKSEQRPMFKCGSRSNVGIPAFDHHKSMPKSPARKKSPRKGSPKKKKSPKKDNL